MSDTLEAMIEAAEQNPDTRVFTNAQVGAAIHGLRRANFDSSAPMDKADEVVYQAAKLATALTAALTAEGGSDGE